MPTPLLYLYMSSLGLTGTMDDSWAALPDLSSFQIDNNNISGVVAPLSLQLDCLTDTGLLSVWHAGQFAASWGTAWPKLESLSIFGSRVHSTLPPEWGANGSFPKYVCLLLTAAS